MRESQIEEYLRERVKAAGGRAYKFVSPGNNGVPDRILSFPGNRLAFVELKATGGKPTPLQKLQAKRLQENQHVVVLIDSKEGVDDFIREFTGKDVMPK